MALAWALERGEAELGLRLAVALENLWVTDSPRDSVRWLQAFLDVATDAPAILRAKGLRALGGSTFIQGGFERGVRLYEESLELCRSVGYELGVAILLPRLAIDARRRGDLARARAPAEEGLALQRRIGFGKGETQSLSVLGGLAYQEGDHERAFRLLERSLAVAEDVGFRWWQAEVLSQLADYALEQGRTQDADRRPAEGCLARGLAVGRRRRGGVARAGRSVGASSRGGVERSRADP